MGNRAAAARDNAPHRLPGFGVHLKRGIGHFLLHLKSSRLELWIRWNGFVNISSHSLV